MKTAIRVDSSLRIGTGHVMRCLALAEELRVQGSDVYFIARDLPGHITRTIEESGFRLHKLPAAVSKSSTWLEVDVQQDVLETSAILKKNPPDWLVVDHYSLSDTWEEKVRPFVKALAVIDDLADRKHLCDLIIDHGYHRNIESRYDHWLAGATRRLLGPKYSLLRREFADASARKVAELSKTFDSIFVFMGGIDATNETAKVIEAIEDDKLLRAEIVVGSNHPFRASIEKQLAGNDRLHLHVQPKDFIELMHECDLAVGAGGTNTWERFCLGLPSIVISVAANQVESTRALADDGYLSYLGHFDQVTPAQIVQKVRDLAANPPERVKLSQRGMSLVDGLGAQRVVSEMKSFSSESGLPRR